MNARRLILVSLCTLVGVLAFSSASAVAFETHVAAQPIGSGEKGSGAGQMDLASNSGVAVDDATGDVYVADTGNDRVDEFEADGAFMRAWGWGVADGLPMFEACGPDAFPPAATCKAGISGSGAGQFVDPVFIAVDNSTGGSKGDVYVGDTEDDLVTKFSAEGALESGWGNTSPSPNGQLANGLFRPMYGIVIDSVGDLSVIGYENDYLSMFTPEGAFSEAHALNHEVRPSGLAVGSEGNFFNVKGLEGSVEENTPSGGDVGRVTLSEDSGLAIDAATGDLYVGTGSEIEKYAFSAPGVVSETGAAPCTVKPEVGCPPTGSFGAGDIGAGAGVAVDASTDTVYVADASTARIDVFVPAIIPDAATGAARQVKGYSATLTGTVDPDGEGPAKCQVVWGTTPEFGHTAPCEPVEVPEGDTPVAVQAKITELQPDTIYYYRVQATNRNGTNVGTSTEDRQFSTPGPSLQPGNGSSVSDVAATSVTLDASIDPDNGPSSPVPGAATSYYFQYSAASTAGCEAAPASCTSVPAAPGEAIGPGESYLEVSQHVQGLSADTVYHYRVVALSESAGETITVDGPDETFTTQLAGGKFQLADGRQWELVSPPDKHGAYIFPFVELGLAAQASVTGDAMTFLTNLPTESEPQGYTIDEQVFATRGPNGWVSRDISPPNERATSIELGHGSEYVAFSENLSLAVVQPRGSFNPSLSPEASAQTPYLRTNFLNGNVDDPCVESCYRPLVTGKPGYANVPPGTVFGQECVKDGLALCGPTFIGATPDLSHIALSSAEPLLGGQNETEGYEWFEGKLSRGHHLPEVRLSSSEDGSWQYFVSQSALAGGAIAGEPNVYVSHGGVTRFIAVVSQVDELGLEAEPRSRTSRVSPDGRWFAFMSQRDLTGYNTDDAVSGQPDEEVYLYHAPEDLATEVGTLVCASCNPTGARPVGVEYKQLRSGERGRVIGESEWPDDTWIAANVPGWTPYALRGAIYQSRYLSDSGRLFFNSNDALVPQDVNGNEDVYEYEPPGVGSCTTASVLYSAHSDGCVDLISSGQDPGESAFMDASGSGGDVFFVTAAKLVPQDYDTSYDVYDAHECTSASPCFSTPAAVPPPCDTGDACKPAPSPQPAIYGAPSSETFSGAGNLSPYSPPAAAAAVKTKSVTRAQKLALALKACHGRRGGRRAACERRAKARYGARKASRAAKRGRG
jgi:hypothetical protein